MLATFFFCGLVIWVGCSYFALGLAKFQLWGFLYVFRPVMCFPFPLGVIGGGWRWLLLGLALCSVLGKLLLGLAISWQYTVAFPGAGASFPGTACEGWWLSCSPLTWHWVVVGPILFKVRTGAILIFGT